MVPMMMKLSGRGGYWSQDDGKVRFPHNDENVRLMLVVVHRMMEIGSGTRNDGTVK